MRRKRSEQSPLTGYWDTFNTTMAERGYSLIVNGGENYSENIPMGTMCAKADKWAPAIRLCVRPYENQLWIFVEDRNGNTIITGNTVGIYTVDCSPQNGETAFRTMLEYVLGKYGSYCKENRLQFDVDKDKPERKTFD